MHPPPQDHATGEVARLGARDERIAHLIHRRSPRASAVLLGLFVAGASLTVCSLTYWATGLHPDGPTTGLAMFGLPVILPLLIGPVMFSRIFRMSGALHERTRELELEVERRREAERQLQILASVDDLTKIANRRAFFVHASQLTDNGQASTVSVIDLDNFKQLNDNLGHAAGDDALRDFGTLLRTVAPPDAILGRLGGEEFGVVIPASSLRDTVNDMNMIRRALADSPLSLTASFGVTDWNPVADDTIDAALARADAALYRAKQRGRDRVETMAASSDAHGTSDLSPLARRH